MLPMDFQSKQKFFKIVLRGVLSFFMLCLLGGLDFALAEPSPRVAIVLPESGPHARYGELQRQGYDLALVHMARDRNPLDVRFFDSGRMQQDRYKWLKELLDWQPTCVIGPYSSQNAELLLSLLAEEGIPVLLPSPSVDHLTQTDKTKVFRLATPSGVLAQSTARFLADRQGQWGTKRIVLVTEDAPFARQAKVALISALSEWSFSGILIKATDVETAQKTQWEEPESSVFIMISRDGQASMSLTQALPEAAKKVGFIAGFVTPAYRQFALDSQQDVYVVSSWDDSRPGMTEQFVKDFLNKYQSALSAAYPQYHNAQAYAALQVMAQAAQKQRQDKKSLTDILKTETFRTALGPIQFKDEAGYFKQAFYPPVIYHYNKGQLQRAQSLSVETSQAVDVAKTSQMPFIAVLLDNQFMALFAIVVLGLLLGNIKVAGMSLGSSGVLFVALLFGHFHFTIPSGTGTLGLIFFIYCVGLSAGPSFFRSFVRQGAKLAQLSVVIIISAFFVAWGLSALFSIPVDLSVGIFAGALTSTPALAAALDTLQDLGALVSVGYGVAYPFGVVGVVLFVQLLPKVLNVDLDQMALDISAKETDESKGPVQRILVEVTNASLFGQRIDENSLLDSLNVRPARILVNNELLPIQYDHVFKEGCVLRLVGHQHNLHSVIDLIGKKVDLPDIKDAPDHESMDLVVMDTNFAGKTIDQLDLLRRFGVNVTRIVRNDVTVIPGLSTKLHKMDVIRVVGPRDGVKKFAKKIGHKEKALLQTDLISLALGMMAGVGLGLMPVSIAGSPEFSLGISGGLLVVSILLGHYGRLGPIVGHIPVASRMLMMEIGLVFFLANAGIKAGGSFVAILQEHGLVLFAIGALVTLVPMFFGYLYARYVLQVSLVEALGSICGGMTSTPALGAIKAKTDSQVPVISYATAYPVALIFMLVFANILIKVLS